jgi:putative transposase
MARQPRLVISYQPLHIMHRGNNRQNIFENDDDMMRLREYLSTALSASSCRNQVGCPPVMLCIPIL